VRLTRPQVPEARVLLSALACDDVGRMVLHSVYVNRPWSRPESLEELSAPSRSCII
jgi:hypothetical protein